MRRELDNLRVQALMIQATAALRLGDPDEAIRCAERILKLDPYPICQAHLSRSK